MSGKFSKVRNVVTWVIVPLIVIFVALSYYIESKYPVAIAATGGPRGPDWLYDCRNLDGLLLLVFSLLALPRWQAFAGLLTLALFVYSLRGI